VRAAQVVELLGRLAVVGPAWVGGGWGVDALVGRQTRPHADLDLAVGADQLAGMLDVLSRLGFGVAVDWLPVRVELAHPDGRRVDVHPLRFQPDGSAAQDGLAGAVFHYAADGFTTGRVHGREVRCLSAAQQLAFRDGYQWREVDRHDVTLLRAHTAR
jgi:lincosamide nucleotidyltransferase A/C/D/E